MASRRNVIELTRARREPTAISNMTAAPRRVRVPVQSEPNTDLHAVMAHSLLSSVAAIKTASAMLEDRQLDDHQTDRVVGIIRRQADHLHEMLKDLVRTGDPALMATLDDLDRRTRSQR